MSWVELHITPYFEKVCFYMPQILYPVLPSIFMYVV